MIDQGLTATKWAELLGYNRETVRKRLALINRTEHGAQYTVREVVDAYVEFERRSITGLDGSKVYDSEHEKARKDAAIADRYELDLQVRRGELVEAEDVKQTWASCILRCKARLLGISTKLAPLLVAEESPKAVKALIDEEINDCLGELSQDANSKRDTD
jgi:BarA-like signal transduction histidine kinase